MTWHFLSRRLLAIEFRLPTWQVELALLLLWLLLLRLRLWGLRHHALHLAVTREGWRRFVTTLLLRRGDLFALRRFGRATLVLLSRNLRLVHRFAGARGTVGYAHVITRRRAP